MADKLNITGLNIFDDTFNDLSVSVQKCIKSIIKKEGYVKYKVQKILLPQAGNFLSTLYEVDITGETSGGEKVISLFIKECVVLEKIKIAEVSDLYCRELFIYNDLATMFLMLQDAANVPDEERFTFLKKYESDNEAIVMENLSKKGFKTYNKTDTVPLKFAELSIIQLAKFHALSYVVKNKIPKYFDDKMKAVDFPCTQNSDWEQFTHNICAVTAQVVKDEAKRKILNYAPRMSQTHYKYISDRRLKPSNGCLCHGDYKFLNIMVKEVDGEVSAVQPIDYQLAYYGSPVNDFLFFIYSGTDRPFRIKHLSHLKDLYFERFANFLSYFNVDVNSAYSRREFENDFEERLELGLVFGLYMSAFGNTEEGIDLTKLSLSEVKIVSDGIFADRVRGIVEDYIEWGYL